MFDLVENYFLYYNQLISMATNGKEKTIEKQKEKIKGMRNQLKNLKSETKKTTKSLITSAFGFVAALFWRVAIKALLDQTVGVNPGEGFWIIQVAVAVIVTIFAVVVTYSLSKL